MVGPALCLLAVLGGAAPASAGTAGERAASRRAQAISLERVAVLGASVSAGFGSERLGALLDRSIVGAHEVRDLADLRMFRVAGVSARRQVDAAVAFRPTLVVAVDFLFWFGYGWASGVDERLARIDVGLAQLERLDAPLLLGDLPDMRTAANWMLPAHAIPPVAELAALNAHLRRWAAAHPRVVVVPLSEWTRQLMASGEVELAPGVRAPSASLMNADGLHVNRKGLLYVAHRVWREALVASPATDGRALALPALAR